MSGAERARGLLPTPARAVNEILYLAVNIDAWRMVQESKPAAALRVEAGG